MRTPVLDLYTHRKRLTGWGLYPESSALVLYADDPVELESLSERFDGSALLARGKGRSYGDASLNRNNLVVSFDRLDKVIEFNPDQAYITCEAGLTLEEILSIILPHGLFLPVTPGTKYPSIGGCFACDVHGKNHHFAGTISEYVRWIDLVCADGKVLRCSRDDNPDVFYATAGGMGLTGFIARISLNLKRISSAYISEEMIRTVDLSETMELLTKYDSLYEYSVAWLDCISDTSGPGRGIVLLGRHAESGTLPSGLWAAPLNVSNGRTDIRIPFIPPFSLANHISMRIFNELRYRAERSCHMKRFTHCDSFFYPLDRIRRWNRLYGRKGFLQYQFVIPFDSGPEVLHRIILMTRKAGHPSSLAVLKRMGKGTGMLSFPRPGWTLAMDFPLRSGLMSVLDELDRVVVDHGGRVYLVKDARLGVDMFRRMYPRFEGWLEIKRRLDPDGRFNSDLARRLEINLEE